MTRRVCLWAGDWGTAQAYPELFNIGRKVSDFDAQSMYHAGLTPQQAASRFVNSQMPTYTSNYEWIKCWLGNNEPVGDAAFIRWYAQMEIERMKIMQGLGMKCVIGNFATGSPELSLWTEFLPACEYAHANGHILGVHEYSAFFMWWCTGGYQLDPSEYCRTSDGRLAGWLTLRYRLIYDQHLIPAGLGDLPLLIDEWGLDRINIAKPGWPDPVPFKGLGNWWADGPNEWGIPLPTDWVPPGGWDWSDRDKFFAQQWAWLDHHMRQDSYLLGATYFTFGSFGAPWSSFDVFGTDVVEEFNIIQDQIAVQPPDPPEQPPSLHWPTDYRPAHITSHYGEERPTYTHEGVDIRTGPTGEVLAANSGQVVRAGPTTGAYGNRVEVRHSERYHTFYAHLSALNVSVGDYVHAGDVLGIAGHTGDATGIHLHLGLWDAEDNTRLRGIARPGWINPEPHLVWPDELPPTGDCKVGVGSANPQVLGVLDWQAIGASRVELVKLLTCDAAANDAMTLIMQGRHVIARLFSVEPGNRPMSAQEFVGEVGRHFDELYAAGVRYFEVHNEPNLPQEGLQVSWANGTEFAQWFTQVYDALKARHADALIGYPGLSPQFSNPNFPPETDTWTFLEASDSAVRRADWLGVHNYWDNPTDGHWGMLSLNGGMLWKEFRARYPDKLLFITEFSDNNRHTDYATKGERYAQYYGLLRNEPNLAGAIAFALHWPGQDVNREGWRTDDEVTAVPGIVGDREF